jgi:hypothetical protein
MASIDAIWARIKAHEGEKFHQVRGAEFTYEVAGNSVVPDRTNRQISKGEFEKSIEFLPLENTTPVQHLQGPSYIYAILMDKRIRKDEW